MNCLSVVLKCECERVRVRKNADAPTVQSSSLHLPPAFPIFEKLDILTLSLPHKFLHRRIESSSDTRVVFISSICIWIPFAYLFYSFAWSLKEGFRLFTSDRGEVPFLTLTTSEQNFYAMWYASVALVITFGFVARPMLLLRLSPNDVATRRRSALRPISRIFQTFFYSFSVNSLWGIGRWEFFWGRIIILILIIISTG